MGWVDHYFSCSTLCRGSWADGKLADLAEQPRKMVEHHTKSQSQPNPTVRADAPPCFQDTSGYPTRTPRNSLTNWARERTTVATASDSDERAESLAGERALMLCGRSVPSPSIVPLLRWIDSFLSLLLTEVEGFMACKLQVSPLPRASWGTVLIRYYDYLGTWPKNSHRPIIVIGR